MSTGRPWIQRENMASLCDWSPKDSWAEDYPEMLEQLLIYGNAVIQENYTQERNLNGNLKYDRDYVILPYKRKI